MRCWIGHTNERDGIKKALHDLVDWLDLDQSISRDAHIILKPNFTYPYYKEGVTTSPSLIDAVVNTLRDISPRISIVESDGGANAWSAEKAFESHNVFEICKRYEIRAVNLTREPRIWIDREVHNVKCRLELPHLLLDERNFFVTLPVPKVHAMTRVSLAFKNQWGCFPNVKRLRNHSKFTYYVIGINQVIEPRLAIFDGTYFLNLNGPVRGEAVRKNLIISGNAGVASRVCCEIMGINAHKVRHLRLATTMGMMPKNLKEIALNVSSLEPFMGPQFRLQRTWMNWYALAAFHSRFLTRIIYDSTFAKTIHSILYLIRGAPKDTAPQW